MRNIVGVLVVPLLLKHCDLVGCLLVPPAPVVSPIDWTVCSLIRLHCPCYLKAVGLYPALCWGNLDFGKTSGQLPGVDIHFRLTLPVSTKQGWSLDTMTIKTHVPTYKESLRNHIILYNSFLTCWHWASLLNFIQVLAQLADSRILKPQSFSRSIVYELA